MDNKKISVVMSTYNEDFEWIKESIESILNQTYTNLEFLIVLDNPKNTELNNFIKSYASRDGRIVIVENSVNIGLVKSLNSAIKQASGEYIMRMDADDISVTNRIEQQIKFLEKWNYDLIAGGMIEIDENGNNIGLRCYKGLNDNNIYTALTVRDVLPHPTWFGKKALFIEMGGYRNIEACEDYDFLLRCINKNKRIGYLKNVILEYRIRSTSISNSKSYIQYRNSIIIKNMYLKGRIEELDEIKNIINSPVNITEKRMHEKACKFVETYKMSDKFKKIILIPKLIWMTISNSIMRRVIFNRAKMRKIGG